MSTKRNTVGWAAAASKGPLNPPFLRTGDLGYIKENELYVSGRLKDLVILHGRNYAPQDLEVEAENSHSDIRSACVAAFTIPRQEQERLILVVELKHTALRRTELWPDIIHSVRRPILHAYQIEVDDVVLLKTGTLPKTSSGKVQRRLCRDAYLANKLERVAPVAKVEASVTPSLLPQQPKAERRGFIKTVRFSVINGSFNVSEPSEVRLRPASALPLKIEHIGVLNLLSL